LLALIAAAVRSQPTTPTICEKYSARLFITEAQLMNITVSEVVAAVALCGSCPTAGWFNGTYFSTDFLTDDAALSQFIAHLMGFFGSALGCNSQTFTSAYSGFATNLQAVHGSGNLKRVVSKAAFEYFNEQVINVLASHGVSTEDLALVSQFLDGFRSTKTGATATNAVCQDPDCTSSPFAIKVAPNYFNPSYVTMPKNTIVVFSKYDLSPHIITEAANGTGECTEATNPAFEIDLTGASAPQDTDPITRDVDFFDVVNCTGTNALTGQIRVMGTNSAVTISICASLVVAAVCSLLL